MKSRILLPFALLAALILLVGLACGTVTTTTPSGASTPGSAPTSGGGNVQVSGAVSSLDNVRSATIQIEAQGTFIDPQFGLQVNAAGRGSGFIIDPSGIAVTNNHVVAGAALVKVWVGGESTPRNARILGLSECSDLAVIDIEGDGYPYLEWHQAPVKTGLEVYSAGFPLGEPEFNLTKGIISKESADGQSDWASIDHVLGHDATINPGNSGGPLVDANGKAVGVNYMLRPDFNQYFAIGGDIAIPIIEVLRTGKDVDSIGVNGTAVLSEDGSLSGIWVASVKSGSPADKAGIQAGDILYQLEGLVLATDGTMKDYCDVIRSHQPSDTLSTTVIRYATGELLEGQLNGRALAVTGTFDTGSAGGDTGDTSGGSGEAPDYFTEEFDGLIPDWTYFLMSGDENKMTLESGNGVLTFNLDGEELYVYVLYDPYTYTDVRLDARVENRGFNSNEVSLICRYDPDYGWYEFAIGNDGLYSIYAYDAIAQGYETLYNGGSTVIHSGKDVNEYTVICSGKTLALYINGVEERTITENRFAFREGQVGISTSSFDVLPIIVEWDWVTISEP
ncbi:MAG: trypsin-like peptidase domain-containing protein [Anaerolineales bacterium]|nr:trypsin-like peptidase domain-containing protein [Anaerolineales bacterium]